MDRPLPREWFVLQMRFAERVAAIGGGEIAEALATQTNLYRSLGLPWGMDLRHPVWLELAARLRENMDSVEWAYRFYLARWRPAEDQPFGCFRYDFVPEGTWIRLHFSNRDGSGVGALSRAQLSVRLSELRAMFAAIARDYPKATWVRGNSWLYGLEAYRRLYPPAFYQTITYSRTENEFQYLALWGQFLDRDGRVRRTLAEEFLERIARARTIGELAAAFRYRVFSVGCDIGHFYDFYDIDRAREAG